MPHLSAGTIAPNAGQDWSIVLKVEARFDWRRSLSILTQNAMQADPALHCISCASVIHHLESGGSFYMVSASTAQISTPSGGFGVTHIRWPEGVHTCHEQEADLGSSLSAWV